ncbi:hypothetical protein E5288_WYG000036 [Bos mutus]|uniref:T-cell leukemia/lymphoma protein 1B n=1 Tax=Bos mutus TaxID=72004 RepID=A0A6B0RHL0_9CETA|nr:hypothetical protein [Bos mutus]
MEAEASPPVGSPPCCLWFQRPGVYEDEKGRIWVAVAMQIIPSYRARGSGAPESTHDDSITVHLWQLPNQMPRSPSSLLVSGLPIKWELYPGRSDPKSLIPETGSSLAEGLELGLLSYPWSCSNGVPAQFLRASLTVNFCLPPDPAGPVP